jgi:hypothetical protein
MEPDGMARLEATAGQEDVAAVWNALTDAARVARRHGDPRTLDQIRLDELVRRTTGTGLPRASATGTIGSTGTTGQTGERDRTGESGEWPAVGVGPASWTSDRRLSVSLLMPLSTYLRLTQNPCALDGYGTIPADLARRIVSDSVRDHPETTTWRCVITSGRGDEHRTVLGVTRPLSTPKHDPPERLADLIRTALPRCVVPGCDMPAARCDLDHRIPYDHDDPAAGGPTCSCNLQPLCRRDHRLKTTGLITVDAIPHPAGGTHVGGDCGRGENSDSPSSEALASPGSPGSPGSLGSPGSPTSLRWTSRAGLTYTFTPEPVLQRAAPEQAEALRPALHDQRHPDPEPLVRDNQELADAIARHRDVRAEIAALGREAWTETWTETIDRPDDDGLHRDRDIDPDALHDPYADLPPPAAPRSDGVP